MGRPPAYMLVAAVTLPDIHPAAAPSDLPPPPLIAPGQLPGTSHHPLVFPHPGMPEKVCLFIVHFLSARSQT